MNECLVTKLKASVADVNLRVLGEFRFTKREDANSADSFFVSVSSKSEGKIEILNDGYFCLPKTTTPDMSAGKTQTFDANIKKDFYISAGSKIRIAPKYELTFLYINAPIVDLSEYAYTTELKSILLANDGITGSIEVFENHTLGTLHVAESKYKVYGNLEKIKDFSQLESLSVTKSHITGDITACFGKSILLTFLGIADSDVSGTIESLVAAQIQSGRETGTITLPYARGCKKVTFEGIALNINPNIPAFASGNQFSWTSDGTITWA